MYSSYICPETCAVSDTIMVCFTSTTCTIFITWSTTVRMPSFPLLDLGNPIMKSILTSAHFCSASVSGSNNNTRTLLTLFFVDILGSLVYNPVRPKLGLSSKNYFVLSSAFFDIPNVRIRNRMYLLQNCPFDTKIIGHQNFPSLVLRCTILHLD